MRQAMNKNLVTGIAAALVVVSGAGAGAYWFGHRSSAEARPRTPERGLVGFDPFVVNLADAGASRFLRVTVQLVVDDEAEAERLRKTPVSVMQARSAILELLTAQTSDRLVTPDGKTALKKAIAERVAAAIEHAKVSDVLFSDFVVQF